MYPSLDRLIWLDLEMTGLNIDKDVIIEIASIITDAQLNIIAEGPCLAIYYPDPFLADMDDWNTKQHNKSGLLSAVQISTITPEQAETLTLDFLKQHVAQGVSPLCGNSVWQDRRYLAKYMPTLEKYFHYRHIDVSSIKELARRWRPELVVKKEESSAHRALSDIRESIAELRHYRAAWMV